MTIPPPARCLTDILRGDRQTRATTTTPLPAPGTYQQEIISCPPTFPHHSGSFPPPPHSRWGGIHCWEHHAHLHHFTATTCATYHLPTPVPVSQVENRLPLPPFLPTPATLEIPTTYRQTGAYLIPHRPFIPFIHSFHFPQFSVMVILPNFLPPFPIGRSGEEFTI